MTASGAPGSGKARRDLRGDVGGVDDGLPSTSRRRKPRALALGQGARSHSHSKVASRTGPSSVRAMGVVLKAVCIFSIAVTDALRIPTSFTRRDGLTTAAAGAVLPFLGGGADRVLAAEKGGVQWIFDLPSNFAVQRQLASIVRVRTETVLQADDAATGATVKLLLLPFGQQAAGSLTADDQFAVATYVYNGEGSAAAVGQTMTASASRSPGVVKLLPQGSASGYTADDGRRYVRYGYTTERCAGDLDDGECFGTLSTRRTLATLTMSSISQYRTNTERERMKEMGQARNVDVLWLLTLSAPEGAAWKALEPEFERLSKTLRIPMEPASRGVAS